MHLDVNMEHCDAVKHGDITAGHCITMEFVVSMGIVCYSGAL